MDRGNSNPRKGSKTEPKKPNPNPKPNPKKGEKAHGGEVGSPGGELAGLGTNRKHKNGGDSNPKKPNINPKKRENTKTQTQTRIRAEKKSEKFVFLRAGTREGLVEWYMICISNTHGEKTYIRQITKKNKNQYEHESTYLVPMLVGHVPAETFYATLGSKLYCLDGTYFRGFTYILDAKSPQSGFIEGPPMLNPRQLSFASSLSLGGKLYVFGGGKNLEPEAPFAECFHPEEGIWKRLSPPPLPPTIYLPKTYTFPYGNKDENILVLFGGSSFIYKVESDTWESYTHTIPINAQHLSNHVKVGNTLYWFTGKIYAHDLDSHNTYSGVIRGCPLEYTWEDVFSYCWTTALFHIGGNDFCVFTHTTGASDFTEPSVFLCTKFRVVKGDPSYLDATAYSQHSFLVDYPTTFIDGLPLNGMFADSLISEITNFFNGSLSGGQDEKNCISSSLVEGTRRLNIRDNVAGTGGKHCVTMPC